jgi:hypothetical protein
VVGTAAHAQKVSTLLTEKLPETPGKEIQVITVNYAPGAVDVIHRHDAHVVVYVLEGEVEMQVRGGALQRLGPGQVFYEIALKTFTPWAVMRARPNQRSSSYFSSRMKEHRFSPPLTNFGSRWSQFSGKTSCLTVAGNVRAKLQKGERVVILGGLGAVGLFAVQLAKSQGAYVIATSSQTNIDFVNSLEPTRYRLSGAPF